MALYSVTNSLDSEWSMPTSVGWNRERIQEDIWADYTKSRSYDGNILGYQKLAKFCLQNFLLIWKVWLTGYCSTEFICGVLGRCTGQRISWYVLGLCYYENLKRIFCQHVLHICYYCWYFGVKVKLYWINIIEESEFNMNY